MQLNIKDEAVVLAARDLAAKLGKSVTATVREALEEKAARLVPEAASVDIDDLLNTARSLRKHWKPEFRDQQLSLTHGDLLYDQAGAPR